MNETGPVSQLVAARCPGDIYGSDLLHIVEWEIDSYSVTGSIRCLAGEGNWCRLTCPEGCEEFTFDGTHAHELRDEGCCNVQEWINASSPEECYDGKPHAAHSTHIDPIWRGDHYVWRYLDESIERGLAAASDGGSDERN